VDTNPAYPEPPAAHVDVREEDDLLVDPDGLRVDDLVEVLREPVAGDVDAVDRPLRQPLGDPGHEELAGVRILPPVAERDQREDPPLHAPLLLLRHEPRLDAVVVHVVAGPLRGDLDVGAQVQLPVLPHEAAAGAVAVTTSDA
jgi:hypothetical protein